MNQKSYELGQVVDGNELQTNATSKSNEIDAADDGIPERETWVNKLDFLLACIGFSVGLGNVWRFPYLCYKNGGGAFLIPYFICVVVGGVPLFFIEVAVGQFMSSSGIKAWKFCPLLQGIGWATTSVVFLVNCFYNVILTWAIYYFFASFTRDLPWDSCDNEWNTDKCRLTVKRTTDDQNLENFTSAWTHSTTPATDATSITATTAVANSTATAVANVTAYITNTTATTAAPIFLDPTVEFWENKVLGISDGIEEVGSIKTDLLLCLVLSWVLVYFCIWKGVKSSGKVVYFTATSPYLLLLVLLVRTSLLDGAMDGFMFYITPDFSKIVEMQVWVDAGTQIFFSYGIALGGLTALGSYNKFHHNSYKDAMIFSVTNSGTSIFAGFTVFNVLGFMAKQQGVGIKDVAESGPGLAFIAYPKAVAQMPWAPLWSAIFFFMIILLGLDSQFVAVEGFVTVFLDYFPKLRQGYKRQYFVAFACLLQFLVGLLMITEGGMYVFQIFDYYAGSRIILLVGCFECIAVAWIYGIDRFYDNLEMMYGFRINDYMKICWKYLSPVFCVVIFVLSTINYSELSYVRPTHTYNYPQWALNLGWTMAVISIVWIPVMGLYNYSVYRKAGKSFNDLLIPVGLKSHQLRPCDKPCDNEATYTYTPTAMA